MFALIAAAAAAVSPVSYATLVVYSANACSTFIAPEERHNANVDEYPASLRPVLIQARDKGLALAPRMTRPDCLAMIAEVNALVPPTR